jgi:prephenate dehydrogenase
MAETLNKLVVIGVGLIGGSFALALKRAGAVGQIIGLGRTPANLETALKLGVIDRIGAIDGDTLFDANLVLLAMPVGQMAASMRAIAPYLGPTAVVTDAGSTKQSVVAAARAELASHFAQFVPGHPIAGAEISGPAAARADLFDGKRVVIAPAAETGADAKRVVTAAWQACGAIVNEMTADAHDRVFAAVSHLPHLLAYALVHEFCERANAGELFGFAAGGFRDFTRIAGSDPEMWRDIFLDNRAALIAELDTYMAKLASMRASVAAGDTAALERLLQRARTARNDWANGRPQQNAGKP